jgi:trans-2,3-dihydro-3-hydroxyanthranilate isomerase
VCTNRAFEGNQLAVCLDTPGLATAEVQTLANEMHFAESTFLLPATSGAEVVQAVGSAAVRA